MAATGSKSRPRCHGSASSCATKAGSRPSMTDAPVLVFDGACVLCSRWVHFVLRHDRDARIRLAPMQSQAGRELLAKHGLDPDDPLSLLYVVDGHGYQDSDAILRVLASFG